MKNATILVEKQDVHDYVRALLRSEPFIESYDNRGFIYDQVERFAWLPRIFAESTNDNLERAHFSTWWNVIMLRDYDNPVIHDLYYLHEMAHAASMPYIEGIGRAAFEEKMQRNELEASVLSEIAVYLEMQDLREKSFEHEIYADRFLDSPKMQKLWKSNREVALETLRSIRRDIMVSKPEHLMDLSEFWIRRFADQNAGYGIVWADRYKYVEARMAQFQEESAADRAQAISAYADWLAVESLLDPIDNIPFRQEAELFSPFYWVNKAQYDAAQKRAKAGTFE
jgi:hypothetical protein